MNHPFLRQFIYISIFTFISLEAFSHGGDSAPFPVPTASPTSRPSPSPTTAPNVDAFNRQYKDIQADMIALSKKYRENVSLVDVGMNDTGQMIQALKFGNGTRANLVVATHHGNEYGSTELALGLMNSLAQAPLKNLITYVIPVLNVSGYNARQRREKGLDPNRNYPGPCGTDGPFTLKSTRALADFIAQKNIVSSATLHTHAPAVLYPWGFSTHDLKTEYDDLYIELGNAAAIESKYKVGNSTAELYPADGTYEDYAMLTHGIWSLLFEVGFSHTPNQAAINELVRVNVPGIRRFLELAPLQRAEKHSFTGKCDPSLKSLDRRDE